MQVSLLEHAGVPRHAPPVNTSYLPVPAHVTVTAVPAKKDGEETPGSAPHSPLKAKASANVRDATNVDGADAMAVCGVSAAPR